ncbi:thiol:disulfide interchange protein CycY [Phenylobacterium zucineum HLK1]|uniref:Thiol:disulfide interchange protein CycY n=1 Tax=Phenylobacterium zucineum (strain HLK1) TaxID=450851 RepID=B4RCF0_PHEZH|nr:DsbE family thiol:disulfide interchange protein [Phenylobacterium zucineum]ACG76549.1 thiol:disulfide interchange protein CycY [Phenylobacterium zucineum HLK1]
MSRWLAWIPLAALVALGLLFGLYALNRNPQIQPQALVGKPVPTVSLPTLAEGQPVSLREMASEGPMIVNFFASWCAPCEIEHPVLMGLKGQPVRVVGIAYKDAPQNSQAFLDRLGDPYAEVLVDRDGRAGVEFGVTGVPETYVVGRDGMILAKHTGPLTEADARRLAAQAR